MGFLTDLVNKIQSGGTASEDSGVSPIDDMSQQTPEERKLVDYVVKKIQESRMSSSRISHEGIWMTNIAYVLGFDGVFYDTTTKQFRSSSKGNTSLRRNRVHVNKILPTVQNRLARLCKSPPKYDVRPNSSDTEDKEASRLGLQVIESVMDKNKAEQKRIDLYMWMQECGHSYIKVCWDDQLGEPMIDPMTGESNGYEGEIRLDVVSAFEVFPDPLAKTTDECSGMGQAKLRKLDYFKTHYPDRGHLVKEEGNNLLSLQYEARINSLNVQGQGQTGSQTVSKNTAIEYVLYERRSEKHPNGRMIVVSNGILLEDKDLPVGEIPLVKFDDVIIGGKYYSESTITHARSLQDQINRVIALRSAYTNKLLMGKYLVAKGSGLHQEAINDQSGEVVEYNPVPNAPPPAALQMPQMPAYAYKEEESLQMQMFDTFGINEVSRGQIPSAGIPAIGMQFLMEQDDTRIGIVTEHNEHSWAKVGSLILKYAAKYYVMPRLLKTAGRNLEYTVKSFVGSELRGHNDVTVIRGSTLPGSKVLKRQEILNLMQQGMFGNPQDPQVIAKVMEMLEYGDNWEAWEDVGIDLGQIERDIQMIEQNQIPVINEFDNHALHLTKKNQYRKSKENDLSPIQLQILMQDMNQRIQILQERANPGLGQMRAGIQQNQQDLQNVSAQAAQANAQVQQSSPGTPTMAPPPAMGAA